MPHHSKASPAKFSGDPSRWAINAANWAANEIVTTGNRDAFIARHPATRRTCIIVPTITQRSVSFLALYGAFASALEAEHLNAGDLAKNWRHYGRAFVLAEFAPSLLVIDHDGSLRGTLELQYVSAPRAPSPAEVDKAFSTRLQERVDRAARHVARIVNAI